MKYNKVNAKIFELSEDDNISFQEAGSEIERKIDGCSREELIKHVKYGGVITEQFDHDSTEEKLFAKYCDVIFAKALSYLGFQARAIDARGDAADVDAKCNDYELVGDAKAFRLSRTAKNAKDFKVESLHQWKDGSDYACLLCPIYQYPNTRSQIYAQSIRYDVTLLSYTHFVFLLESEGLTPADLESLWQLSGTLEEKKKADPYWQATTEKILEITGRDLMDWDDVQRELDGILVEQARNEIQHWEERKEDVRQLSHDEATEMLIDYMKIDSKIDMIRKTANMSK